MYGELQWVLFWVLNNTHPLSFRIHAQIKITASKVYWDIFRNILVMTQGLIHWHSLLVVPQMERTVTNPHICFYISLTNSKLKSKKTKMCYQLMRFEIYSPGPSTFPYLRLLLPVWVTVLTWRCTQHLASHLRNSNLQTMVQLYLG